MLIWQILRRHHLATQYQALFLLSLCYGKNLFEAINIHKDFCGEKMDPKPSITLLNKTNTCNWYDFNIDIINNDEYNALQKELLVLFEQFCIFGFGNSTKIALYFGGSKQGHVWK
jgi:hypothetical protein